METVLQPATPPRLFERPSVVPMPYEDYLALPDHVHTLGLVEWVHNEAIFHMPPNISHQNITTFLAALLRFYVQFFKLGQIFASPIEVKLAEGISREPDVVFVLNRHLSRVTAQRIEGAPDLIVEIISPESVTRDLDQKFDEYQDAGVQEYWIVDPRPRRRQTLFYHLGADGLFKPINVENGIFRSLVVTNFWLQIDWLWQTPDPLLTLAEIAHFPQSTIDTLKQLQAKQDS